MEIWVAVGRLIVLVLIIVATLTFSRINRLKKAKKYERSLRMKPLLIHLPPTTDDIDGGGRDRRDVAEEAISKAQVMYSILASTATKGRKAKFYGERHFSLEIIAKNGIIRYYAIVPTALSEIAKQAIQSAYPTARIEEKDEENIFEGNNDFSSVSGAELTLSKEFYLPIATYEDTKRDASMAILNALASVDQNEGAAVQILFRPANKKWSEPAKKHIETIQTGKKTKTTGAGIGQFVIDVIRAPFEVPEMHEKTTETETITTIKTEEVTSVMNKMRYPAFETLIRVVVSSSSKPRSEAILGGIVSAFSQFNSPENNGFKVNMFKDAKRLCVDYVFRFFPLKVRTNILNSVELASIYHLPEQNSIPNSQVERQLVKQVDGPARLATEGIFLGTNEFRGQEKPIYLSDDDRRRHMYVIGQTGMGKSVFLENIAFQDMCDGRGFAFIDPHGDAVEALLKRVPEERIDDVIYFDPADIEHPVGMNMFEFNFDHIKLMIKDEHVEEVIGEVQQALNNFLAMSKYYRPVNSKYALEKMESRSAAVIEFSSTITTVLMVFAFITVLISIVNRVSRNLKDYSIHIALGASRGNIVGFVVSEMSLILLCSIILGTAVTRMVTHSLYIYFDLFKFLGVYIATSLFVLLISAITAVIAIKRSDICTLIK